MSTYKYYIEMSYLDVDSSKTIEIRPENIRTLCIDYDYDGKNTPILISTLLLEKQMVDDMIINFQKNLINLAIYKVVVDPTSNETDMIKTLYFKDQFTYIIQGDINHEEERDYPEEDDTPEELKFRQYREITIGLINKRCLDENKTVLNKTFYNTNMYNLNLLLTAHMKSLVIEPFTYNESIAQILLPPKNTISKTLDFLNKRSVFYDTKYRYFIDFDTTYLLSSSGKPIKKKNEKYSSVIINVYDIRNEEGMITGMTEENNAYVVPVSITDTTYSINTALAKKSTNIIAVLDATREQAEKNTSETNNTVNKLKGFVNDVNTNMNSFEDTFSSSVSNVHSLKAVLYEETQNISTVVIGLEDVRINIKSILQSQDISEYNQQSLTTELFALMDKVIRQYEEVKNLPTTYSNISDRLYKNLSSANVSGSFVNGVDVANIKDNVSALQSHCNITKSSNEDSKKDMSDIMTPSKETIIDMSKSMTRILNIVKNMPDEVDELEEDPLTGEPTIVFKDISAIKEYIPILEEYNDMMKKSANDIGNGILNIEDLPSIVEKIVGALVDLAFDAIGIPNILKQDYDPKGIASSAINSLTNGLNNSLNKLLGSSSTDFKNAGFDKAWENSLKGLENVGTNIANSIRQDLDKISDLSDVTALKFTKVDTDININTSKHDTAKSTILRIPNGNINFLKNVKSELELSYSRFMVNKNGLDGSVFTPNKEYTVKNYEKHSDKDGKFLLSRKREIYLREDNLFAMNCLLDLKQIQSNKLSGNSKESKNQSKQSTSTLDKVSTTTNRLG